MRAGGPVPQVLSCFSFTNAFSLIAGMHVLHPIDLDLKAECLSTGGRRDF